MDIVGRPAIAEGIFGEYETTSPLIFLPRNMGAGVYPRLVTVFQAGESNPTPACGVMLSIYELSKL
jgi:hypothetical protein